MKETYRGLAALSGNGQRTFSAVSIAWGIYHCFVYSNRLTPNETLAQMSRRTSSAPPPTLIAHTGACVYGL